MWPRPSRRPLRERNQLSPRHCLRQTLSVCARERSDDLSAVARRAKAEAIHLSALPRDGLLRFARNDGLAADMLSPSRGAIRPRSQVTLALKNRGRREDRVRAAPAVSCAICAQRKRTRAYRFSGGIRPSLRSGFTAYFVLSPVNGFLATVIPEKLASQDLTPAPRRQDHTTSPYASRAFVLRAFRVHRIPPHVRDDRDPPLNWVRHAKKEH